MDDSIRSHARRYDGRALVQPFILFAAKGEGDEFL